MNWTTIKPTKSGWYWVRDGDGWEWPICLELDNNLNYTMRTLDIIEFSSTTIPKPEEVENGERKPVA